MVSEARAAAERVVIHAAMEAVVGAGCKVTILDWKGPVLVEDGTEIPALVDLFVQSENHFFQVSRVVNGVAEQGDIDFLSVDSIKAIASPNLELEGVLEGCNALIQKLL